jgi:chromosome segregation ATPase
MAPRDAAGSTEQAIENLKKMLTTLTSVNEEMHTQVQEILEGVADRDKFIKEVDDELVDATHRLKNLEDHIENIMDKLEGEHDADLEKHLPDRLEKLAHSYPEQIAHAVEAIEQAHTDVTSAHAEFVDAHEEYLHVQQETLEISSALSEDYGQAYESHHAALTEAHDHVEHATEETKHGFLEALTQFDEHSRASALQDLQTFIGYRSDLMEGAAAGLKALRAGCTEHLESFHQAAVEAADHLHEHSEEVMDGFCTHVTSEVHPTIKDVFAKAHDDHAPAALDELQSLGELVSHGVNTAEALMPMVPFLTVTGSVIESFERVLEALSPGE